MDVTLLIAASSALLFVVILVALIRRQRARAAQYRHDGLYLYAASIGAEVKDVEREEEIARLTGATFDGIDWTLHVLSGFNYGTDWDYHSLLWQTAHYHAPEVEFTLGDGWGDEDLKTWRTKPGVMHGRAPIPAESEELMARFVAAARPVSSEAHRNDGFSAFSVDDALTARVLREPLERALQEWRHLHSRDDASLRLWIGGPDVRVDARIASPGPESYQLVVKLGALAARLATSSDVAPAIERGPSS